MPDVGAIVFVVIGLFFVNSFNTVGGLFISGLGSRSAIKESVRFLFFAEPFGVAPSSFGVAGIDAGFLPKLSFNDGVLTGVCELGVAGCEGGLLVTPFEFPNFSFNAGFAFGIGGGSIVLGS